MPLGLGLADSGSLEPYRGFQVVAGIILLIPAIYTGWTIERYFGIPRALGGDLRMTEALLKASQNQIVEQLREYLLQIYDDFRWNRALEQSQSTALSGLTPSTSWEGRL